MSRPEPPPYTAGPYRQVSDINLPGDPRTAKSSAGYVRPAPDTEQLYMLLVFDYGGRDDASCRLLGAYPNSELGTKRAAEHARVVDGLIAAAPVRADFRKGSG